MAIDAITLSLAKKTRSSSTVGANRTCFNNRSRENKCDNSMPNSVGRVCTLVEPIYYGGRS